MKPKPHSIETKPRPHIAALADILKQYKPEREIGKDEPIPADTTFTLVNEIPIIGQGFGGEAKKHAHTVDQLLVAIGQAWMEIAEMGKELATQIAMNDSAKKLLADTYKGLMGVELAADRKPLEDMDKQASYLRKCEDVLRSIRSNVAECPGQKLAVKFFQNWEPPTVPGRVLVNEKANGKKD